MGDDLQVRGGAGGLTARFDDMATFAGVVDRSADTLRDAGLAAAAVTASADLAQAAVLCPAEVAATEAALALAAGGPQGALPTSTEMEVLARLVRGSVDAYRFTDAQLATLADLGWDVTGLTLGVVGVPAVAGGVALLALDNPLLLASLGAAGFLDRGQLVAEADQTLYDNPWLEESLTRLAPGMVQGGALAVLGPWAPLVSGGAWPTTDFPTAVAGLINAAGLVGGLQDTGRFGVSAVPGYAQPVDLRSSRFVETVFAQQESLAAHPGQVQVVEVPHASGPSSYVVQIPGTQDWSPVRGDTPVDLTTNVWLEAGRTTRMEAAVQQAMVRAGVPPNAPVMLTGHSQGGITAAALTTDPAFMHAYHVTSVVTAGSPIGHIDVPDSVSVLSLEHEQDIVPKLEGADNPDRPSWVTVTRHLDDAESTVDGHRSAAMAHYTRRYARTGADIDASTAETIERWRQQNAAFFTDGGSSAPAVARRYQITPVGP